MLYLINKREQLYKNKYRNNSQKCDTRYKNEFENSCSTESKEEVTSYYRIYYKRIIYNTYFIFTGSAFIIYAFLFKVKKCVTHRTRLTTSDDNCFELYSIIT